MSVPSVSFELWDLIKQEWERDSKVVELISQVQKLPNELPKFRWADGVLIRKGKLVVVASLQTRSIILEWLHASLVGGHFGVRATEKRIKSLFY